MQDGSCSISGSRENHVSGGQDPAACAGRKGNIKPEAAFFPAPGFYICMFILHRAIPVTSVVGYARKKETRFIVGTIPR